MSKFSWYGKQVAEAFKGDAAKRLNNCAYYLQRRIRDSISVPNPTGRDPSQPGEPPRRVTGTLMEAVKVKRASKDDLFAQVYLDPESEAAYYGWRLEFGTRHMAPRPFLRKEFEKFRVGMTGIFIGTGRLTLGREE